MDNNKIPGPETARATRQHPCADLDRTTNLIKFIPEKPEVLTRLRERHILSMTHMDADLLRQLCLQAAFYEFGELGGQPMAGRILGNLFLDQSHEHTRLAFNTAWQRLGGSPLNLRRAMRELSGSHRAWDEYAAACNSYCDIALLRTADSDSFDQMVEYAQVPVINAGNGGDEHPSHAMTDLYTLFKWRPELLRPQVPSGSRIQIAIGGDTRHTGTLRSFLYGLAHFPQAVERIIVLDPMRELLCDQQRAYLADAGLCVEAATALYPGETPTTFIPKILPDMDLIYLHYPQHPAPACPVYPPQDAVRLKAQALMLNPQIRKDTFSRLFNDSPHNGYFAHARGGVYMRMAMFQAILGQY